MSLSPIYTTTPTILATTAVTVARFQTDRLHSGHIAFLEYLQENYAKVIVFLGVSRIVGTVTNPLDFAARAALVKRFNPNFLVAPLPDMAIDAKWSASLDARIGELTGPSEKIVLIGCRDSFIGHYLGNRNVIELKAEEPKAASLIRKQIGLKSIGSDDFRRGVIWSTQNRFPITYPTVDFVVWHRNGANKQVEVLMGQKPGEPLWRFGGGFVDVADETLEDAALRECREEMPGPELNKKVVYLGSHKINDWRYKGTGDGIMTSFFAIEHLWGLAKAGDDLADVKWFYLDSLTEEDVMPVHVPLLQMLKVRVEQGVI